MLVQQAIFASARTSLRDGYHLVAQSEGIDDADARELTLWGPSHDSLLCDAAVSRSINFFPLPSGAFCVSRTCSAGEEYSGRGVHLRTHCLIAPPDVLARFANNPFAVLRAAVASGALASTPDVPDELYPLPLAGRARAVDVAAVEQAIQAVGADRWRHALAMLIENEPVGLVANTSLESTIAGLLCCIPVECRGSFSFSTGLKYSPRRPFRLVVMENDLAEIHRLERHYQITPLDLSADKSPPKPANAWAQFVAEYIRTDGIEALAVLLDDPRPGLTLADLPSLAAELRDGPPPDVDEVELRKSTCRPVVPAKPPPPEPDERRTLRLLEQLDDAVFAAISGDSTARDCVSRLWPQVAVEVGVEASDESRSQYLRRALDAWHRLVTDDADPQPALVTLDVVDDLFEYRPT